VVTIDVRHDGLGRLERVVAPTQVLAEQRASALKQQWDATFERRQAANGPAAEALARFEADERTRDAERAVDALTSILLGSLATPPVTGWAPLYDSSDFAEARPTEPPSPQGEPEPRQQDFPRAQLTLATLVNPRAMRRRRQAAEAKFNTAHDGWLYLKRWRQQEHEKALQSWRAALAAWQDRETAFREIQGRANARLDALAQGYAKGEPEAVTGLGDLNLLALDRPAGFPRFWTMTYSAGVLQIDYDLPGMEVVPLVKSVKYVPSRGTFAVTALGERERERLYGEAMFQTTLAVLHILFSGDGADHLRAIAFNGWTNYVDAAAMRPGRACILSVTADKRVFQGIDLAAVDPKACFRALNGSMSAKLAAFTTGDEPPA